MGQQDKAAWRGMTREEVQANPMAYHRSRYLERRRAYPAHTKLELTEYGFMRRLAGRRTLLSLRTAELIIENRLAWFAAADHIRRLAA